VSDIPETFWAYLAGFIDGEGSLGVYQSGPRICVSNTHLEVLEWFIRVSGSGVIGKRTGSSQFTATKQCYQLHWQANGCRQILPKIIPFMHEKKERAELLLEYLDSVQRKPGQQVRVTEAEIVRRTELIGRINANGLSSNAVNRAGSVPGNKQGV